MSSKLRPEFYMLRMVIDVEQTVCKCQKVIRISWSYRNKRKLPLFTVVEPHSWVLKNFLEPFQKRIQQYEYMYLSSKIVIRKNALIIYAQDNIYSEKIFPPHRIVACI